MRRGNDLGVAFEMAVLTRVKGAEVHVFERLGADFVRIARFEAPGLQATAVQGQGQGQGQGQAVVRVVYGGRCHYDALILS